MIDPLTTNNIIYRDSSTLMESFIFVKGVTKLLQDEGYGEETDAADPRVYLQVDFQVYSITI